MDARFKNIGLLSLLTLLLSIEALVILSFVFSFLPLKASPLLQTLFVRHQPLVMPEREMMLFKFFIIVSFFIQASGLYVNRLQLNQASLTQVLQRWLVLQVGCVAGIIFLVFKFFVFPSLVFFKVAIGLMIVLSLFVKIFAKEIFECVPRLIQWFSRATNKLHVRRYSWFVAGSLIFLIIWPRDFQAVLAKMFVTDHFHHLDTMIVSPAWAYLKGSVLNIDQFTHYSIGLPVVIAGVLKGLGLCSYEGILMLMVSVTICYYWGVLGLFHRWFGHISWALAAVLLTIKWQMFHPGVAPIIYNYPSATVLRNLIDVPVFILILLHLTNPKGWHLAIAGALCGFSIFYMFDTGLYLSLAFLSYGLFCIWQTWAKGGDGWLKESLLWLRWIFILVAVGALCLWLTQGQWLFSKAFWENMSERTMLFLMGHGNLPIYQTLQQGHYLESFIGFLMPIVYVLTGLIVTSLVILGLISQRWIWLSIVCLYGLGCYNYYVCRSAATSYYVMAWPFAVCLVTVVKVAIDIYGKLYTRRLGFLMVVFMAFCLLTNHYFLNYPNLLHLSANPITKPFIPMSLPDGRSFFFHNDVIWPENIKLPVNSLGEKDEGIRVEGNFASDEDLKQYFKEETDFKEDALLIMQHSRVDEKVALISSFETSLLMLANRRPFFYYFPLVDSRPMRMRMWDMTALWSKTRLQKTLKQLQEEKPVVVFIEKVLWQTEINKQYEYLYPDLLVIMNYLHQHYQSAGQGKFLLELRIN